MNKKRFIAQSAGPSLIKVFDAETGQLYRVISVSGTITSPPICTEYEMYVGVCDVNKFNVIVYYDVPTFNIARIANI